MCVLAQTAPWWWEGSRVLCHLCLFFNSSGSISFSLWIKGAWHESVTTLKKKKKRPHVDVLSQLLVAPGASIKGAICHVWCKIKNSSVWCLQSWLDSGLHLRRNIKFRTQIMSFFSVTFLEPFLNKRLPRTALFFLYLSPNFYRIGCNVCITWQPLMDEQQCYKAAEED